MLVALDLWFDGRRHLGTSKYNVPGRRCTDWTKKSAMQK